MCVGGGGGGKYGEKRIGNFVLTGFQHNFSLFVVSSFVITILDSSRLVRVQTV